jgi:hypothetical protein
MITTRTELTAWITLALILALCGLSHADDRPRAPIPRAPLPSPVIVEPAKPTTPTKPEQSDLHSHLCSNPRCNHEWWHDPTRGPVSHNCPKCGREQWIINRHAPTVARSTTSPAASLQQVVRAPVFQKTVYVVGATWCGACVAFHKRHGDGTAELKYVYADIDKPRPASIDVVTWNELVRLNNSGRFVYPFFVVKLADGEFVGAQARVE